MGIRFYCPNGHKLNVKAFLAGKRGICPHCGAKVQIPEESALPASNIDTPRDENGPGCPPPITPPSAADDVETVREETPSGPAEEPSDVGVSGGRPDMPSPSVSEIAIPPTGPEKSTPQPGVPSDPVAEAPDAVWYVRPPAGGQFGPADGQTMRQWIEEGRIGGDSLVWREGWRDWQEASAAFHRAESSGPIPKIDTSASPLASPKGENGDSSRRKPTGKPASIVTVLVLAIIGLSAALAWVLLR